MLAAETKDAESGEVGEFTDVDVTVDEPGMAFGGLMCNLGCGAGGLSLEIVLLVTGCLLEGFFLADPFSTFARFANRNPHALQSVFGPFGPLRHSGD